MAVFNEAEWFDTAMYAPTLSWTHSDWLVALSARQVMQGQIDRALGGEPRQGFEDHANGHFELLRQDVKVGWGTLMDVQFLPRTSPWKVHHSGAEVGAVLPVDDMDGRYEPAFLERLEFAAIYVDLTAPDRTLIDAFERWLRSKRQESARISVLTELDLRSWVRCHALPYIDLRQYMQFSGRRITYARIADALFPEAEVDRVERLRKVTIKCANNLMTEKVRNALAAQIGELRGDGKRA